MSIFAYKATLKHIFRKKDMLKTLNNILHDTKDSINMHTHSKI